MTFYGNERSTIYYNDYLNACKDIDLVVSCQTRKKLPVGGVNIHYGVLPYYRGCNPIYHSMMGGSTAGITLHWIDDGWDTGNIIDVYEFPHCGMTANEVYDECEKQGLILLRRNLARILEGYAGEKQNEICARYYKQGIVEWDIAKRIHAYICDDEAQRVFATHFEGKQYPIININGRDFELRAV